MTRALHKLTDAKAKGKLASGRHSDGGGLYLNVGPTGGKSWLFMWVREGKRREMGLGAYPTVSLSKARAAAADCRQAAAEGRDPIAERNREAEPTFGEAGEKFILQMESSWRNAKHRAQWRATLQQYCGPIWGERVSLVGTEQVLSVLTPIWTKKPETASRVRGRIERVLDFARVKGWRTGTNPALWRGHLMGALPKRVKLTRGHHRALPYSALPGLFGRIRDSQSMAARALELTILAVTRTGETLGARWPEFDLDAAVWVIPAGRMKAGKEHRVPLPSQALDLLRGLRAASVGEFVFPGEKPNRPLSSMAMLMLLRRMKVDATVHGFRSSFRDWAGDETSFPRDLAEVALAHKVGDDTEAAYRRSDALARRRKLMQAWADYLQPSQVSSVVVNIAEAAASRR